MRRLLSVVALAALLAACSSGGGTATAPSSTSAAVTTTTVPRCTATAPPKLARVDLNVGGKDRYALVHIPAHWNGKTRVPLVVSFHGLGSTAEQQRSSDNFVTHADKDNFIVVYPQAGGEVGDFGAAWDLRGDSEVVFVNALLDRMEA